MSKDQSPKWRRGLVKAGVILRGRVLGIIASGFLFYAFLEFGPLTAIAILFVTAPLAGAVAWYSERRQNQRNPKVVARRSVLGDRKRSPSGFVNGPALSAAGGTPVIPFGEETRRRATSMLLGRTRDDAVDAESVPQGPRFFDDPLAGRRKRAAPDTAFGDSAFTLSHDPAADHAMRQEFDEYISDRQFDEAERVLTRMSAFADAEVWCANAARRLRFHRRVAASGAAPAPAQPAAAPRPNAGTMPPLWSDVSTSQFRH